MENTTQPAGQAAPTATPEPTQNANAQAKKYADRYESPEQLEKGYKELQASFTKQAQELASFKKGGSPTTTEAPSEPVKTETTKPNDISLFQALTKEYLANNGKFSDQTIDLVAKQMGMPKAVAARLTDFYAAENKRGMDQLSQGLKEAGLAVSVDEVLAKAQNHLTPQQWAQVQASLDVGLTGAFVDAARLVAKKSTPAAQVGSVDSGMSGVGFNSADEIQAATTHKDFTRSKEYTKNVEARLNATSPDVIKAWQSWKPAKRK